EILGVHQRHAAGVGLEILGGVLAAHVDPAAIQFELLQVVLGFLQQHVVERLPAAHVGKYQVVVVIRVLQARLLRFFAQAIGVFRGAFGAIERIVLLAMPALGGLLFLHDRRQHAAD